MADKDHRNSTNPKSASPEEIEAAVRNKSMKHSSRRGFIKKAVIGAVAVTATAKAAQKTASYLADVEAGRDYMKDIEAGDRALKAREYVEMTPREKKDLVRMFTEDYGKTR